MKNILCNVIVVKKIKMKIKILAHKKLLLYLEKVLVP